MQPLGVLQRGGFFAIQHRLNFQRSRDPALPFGFERTLVQLLLSLFHLCQLSSVTKNIPTDNLPFI